MRIVAANAHQIAPYEAVGYHRAIDIILCHKVQPSRQQEILE